MGFRIGQGYDVHRLVPDRKLILGGIAVPYELGLLGHSDADVLTHAIMDAVLGALALGDIGAMFPDSDPAYQNISSMELLDTVSKMIPARGYALANLDVTVVAQRPKLSPYILSMRQRLAGVLDVDVSQISIKATTEEGLGFTGESLGIAAQAVVLLESRQARP